MSDKIKAIETRYKGRRFRSRLEARWFIFFESFGLQVEYEREGFVVDGIPYLPDFYIPAEDLWIEIKPSSIEPTAQVYAESLLMGLPGRTILVCGEPCSGKYRVVDTKDSSLRNSIFLTDRRDDHCLWIFDEDTFSGSQLTSCSAKDHDKLPIESDFLQAAYNAAIGARFEHGEGA